MKEIKGYVFVPYFKNSDYFPLFGPNKNLPDGKSYENVCSNGLQVFSLSRDTHAAAQQYEKDFKDIEKIVIGKLEMKIAESVEELDFFHDKEHLIMITNPVPEYPDHNLYGPLVDRASALPYLNVSENGFTTFNFKNSDRRSRTSNPYARAEYALHEANRQGQLPATIATFSLKFFKKPVSLNKE